MESRFRAQPYERSRDFPLLRSFLTVVCGAEGPAGGYNHLGDLLWGTFLATLREPAEEFRMWVDHQGDMAGFVWRRPGDIDFQIRPDLRESPDRWELLAEMLGWAGARRVGDDMGVEPSVNGLGSDRPFATWMAGQGYTRSDDPPMLILRRTLAEPIPDAPLPPGYTVRPLLGPEEYAQRVEIHREVWDRSRLTVDGYARLRETDGYDAELDLVAASEAGVFGAYAICWWDPTTRGAEFEPVGAREAFRQRGLAKAVLVEAMHRVSARGARTLYVYTSEDRLPARRLYESVGFREIDRWIYYRRT